MKTLPINYEYFKIFINFLKKEQCYSRFRLCCHKYPVKASMDIFLEKFNTPPKVAQAILFSPFVWAFQKNEINSENFWIEIHKKFINELLCQNKFNIKT